MRFLLIGSLFFSLQIGFGQEIEQQIISQEIENPSRPIAGTIDSDTAADLVVFSNDVVPSIHWFKNLDGQGAFGEPQVISNHVALYLSTSLNDIDGDGDNDLVYLENNPNVLAWSENLDGEGSFGPRQIVIEEGAEYIQMFMVTDLDNDSDLDIVIVASGPIYDRFVWYENLGNAIFQNAQVLLDEQSKVQAPSLYDFNQDGQLDLLFAHSNDGPPRVAWFQNNGNLSFIETFLFDGFTIPTRSDDINVWTLDKVDINTDGIKDVVAGAFHDKFGDLVYWAEGLDGMGSFGNWQNLSVPNGFQFYDMDNDGDQDILQGNRFVDRVYWRENQGDLTDFNQQHTITTQIDRLTGYFCALVDGDNRIDLVTTSSGDNKIAWYQNAGTLNTQDLTRSKLVIYPNPTPDLLQIKHNLPIESIAIYNSIGTRLLLTTNTARISLARFPSGLYFVKVKDELGMIKIDKVVKE